jgi:electron transfer flavoprotein alpha subunit
VKTLVFLEHHGEAITAGALGALAKAVELGGDAAGVLVGSGVRELADEAGAFGAATVFVADDPRFAASLPGPRVDALAQIVRDNSFDTVFFAQSVLATDIAAALAVRLEAGLNWDLLDIALEGDELVAKRPALADSVVVDVGWTSTVRLALFRSGAFEPVRTGGRGDIEAVSVEPGAQSLLAALTDRAVEEAPGPSIADADVVVAGGRGLGGPEGFALVEELAGVLGGAVGATRAVVDAGWYPYSAQIGQTGRSVAPGLYIALGISGAIQHKVGMQRSAVIVSINQDPHAPIFEFSDLGVVGDLHAIVPKVVELLGQRQGA